MASLSDWDKDFSRGKKGEDLVEDAIMTTQEIKTDYRWQDTGNMYVEYECWYNSDQVWKPSGINSSKAEYYTFVLPRKGKQPIFIGMPTQLLKQTIETRGRLIQCIESDNPSKGYLVKVSDIMEVYLSD